MTLFFYSYFYLFTILDWSVISAETFNPSAGITKVQRKLAFVTTNNRKQFGLYQGGCIEHPDTLALSHRRVERDLSFFQEIENISDIRS